MCFSVCSLLHWRQPLYLKKELWLLQLLSYDLAHNAEWSISARENRAPRAGATCHPKQALSWSCLSPCFTPVSLFTPQRGGRCSPGGWAQPRPSMWQRWGEAPGRDAKLLTEWVHWASLHSKRSPAANSSISCFLRSVTRNLGSMVSRSGSLCPSHYVKATGIINMKEEMRNHTWN